MSDTPGGKPHPRDRRRGDRSRNRNRPPQQKQKNESHPPREDRPPRRRHRERRQDRPHRTKEPASTAAPAVPAKTLGGKILKILTFGLAGSKSKSRPAAPESGNTAPQKQSAPVPPPDPGAITSTRIFVGNLHYDIVESDLLDLFKGIGPVKSVDIVYNGRTHRSKGFGFVEYMSRDDARRAVTELHGQLYMRRPLLLGPARDRGQDEREADTPD